jgi:hypothetical protein
MGSSDFEHKNDGEHYMLDLAELNKKLKLKSDDYERLEYLESVKTEHEECVHICALQIKKIKKLNKYKREFHTFPSPLPVQPPSKNIAPVPVLTPVSEKIIDNKTPVPSFPGVKIKKLFPDYLLHEKRDALASALKTEFITEKGKGIRLLIEALLANKPALITIENRERTNIYKALKTYFDRNIGTYQSIFDYSFDMISDEKDFDCIKVKLDFVLDSLASQGVTIIHTA